MVHHAWHVIVKVVFDLIDDGRLKVLNGPHANVSADVGRVPRQVPVLVYHVDVTTRDLRKRQNATIYVRLADKEVEVQVQQSALVDAVLKVNVLLAEQQLLPAMTK